MTVTLFIDGRRIELVNAKCCTSEMIMGLLSDLQLDNVDITVPVEYLSVIDEYVNYINRPTTGGYDTVIDSDVGTLVSCFFMETFFADSTFLTQLIKYAYGIWCEFVPFIPSLPNKRQIYLHSPYEYVPDDYMSREAFFNEWLQLNANSDIILNGDETCSTEVTYHHLTSLPYQGNHPSQQIKRLFTCHLAKRPKDNSMIGRWLGDIWSGEQQIVAYSFEQTWYQGSNSRVESRKIYKNGEIDIVWTNWCKGIRPENGPFYKNSKFDGSWMHWHENGQLILQGSYKDGKKDGEWLYWFKSGQLWTRCSYKHGLCDGIAETWYWLSDEELLSHKTPQLHYQHRFKDGRPEGLWIEWNRNGQVTSENYYGFSYLRQLLITPTSRA